MFERFRIGLCHPKLIGMFYKDSFLKVFAYLISLFLVYTGLCALISYNMDHFPYDDTEAVNQYIYNGDDSDISFNTYQNKITGTPIKFESSTLIINFLVSENYANTTNLVFRFKEDSVEVLFRGYVISTTEYKNIDVDSFTLANVKIGNDKDVSEFQDMVDGILENANTAYATVYFIEGIITGLMFLGMVFVFCILSSYFTNPSIGTKIRIKLCLYSIGVFFLIMMLSELFNVSWLQYVAIVLPFIYSNITFSHIIRVDKKKE